MLYDCQYFLDDFKLFKSLFSKANSLSSPFSPFFDSAILSQENIMHLTYKNLKYEKNHSFFKSQIFIARTCDIFYKKYFLLQEAFDKRDTFLIYFLTSLHSLTFSFFTFCFEICIEWTVLKKGKK